MSKIQPSAPKTGFSKDGRLLLLIAGLNPREGEFLAKSTAVCACGRSLAEGCRELPCRAIRARNPEVRPFERF